ncbi:hypothetical protein VKT23_001081 [Stygiomarasmius scandens]|uniref:Uncharacterized protein n=1 Tax=Marasmiellus scandens TaxID=2682957 RepID=A0ABR1K713_9AGAR
MGAPAHNKLHMTERRTMPPSCDNNFVVSIVLSGLGGLAFGVLLILALIAYKRRRHHKEDQVESQMSEIYSVPSPVPSSANSSRFLWSPNMTSPPAVHITDGGENQEALNPEKKRLPRIIISTSINPEQAGSTRTPKFRIKRVPVPRLSRLPPTPVAKTSNFARRFSHKCRRGLPSSVRPVPRSQVIPLDK